MVAADAAPPQRIPESDLVLVLSLVMFSAAFFVSGIVSLVTCEPTGIVGNSVTCPYPFQTYGFAFLYASTALLVVTFYLFVRAQIQAGKKSKWDPRLALVVLLILDTMAFFLAYFLA